LETKWIHIAEGTIEDIGKRVRLYWENQRIHAPIPPHPVLVPAVHVVVELCPQARILPGLVQPLAGEAEEDARRLRAVPVGAEGFEASSPVEGAALELGDRGPEVAL
jgi:hypothetical protein